MILLQCLLAQQVGGFSTAGSVVRSFQHRASKILIVGSYGFYPTQASLRSSHHTSLSSTTTSNNEETGVIPITVLSGFLGRLVSICDVQFCAYYDVHFFHYF